MIDDILETVLDAATESDGKSKAWIISIVILVVGIGAWFAYAYL